MEISQTASVPVQNKLDAAWYMAVKKNKDAMELFKAEAY